MQNMGEKAQEVTLGTEHVRAKILALLASCEKSLQVFKQMLKGDILGWLERGMDGDTGRSETRKLVLMCSCIKVQLQNE